MLKKLHLDLVPNREQAEELIKFLGTQTSLEDVTLDGRNENLQSVCRFINRDMNIKSFAIPHGLLPSDETDDNYRIIEKNSITSTIDMRGWTG
jgi:hypothetical protein